MIIINLILSLLWWLVKNQVRLGFVFFGLVGTLFGFKNWKKLSGLAGSEVQDNVRLALAKVKTMEGIDQIGFQNLEERVSNTVGDDAFLKVLGRFKTIPFIGAMCFMIPLVGVGAGIIPITIYLLPMMVTSSALGILYTVQHPLKVYKIAMDSNFIKALFAGMGFVSVVRAVRANWKENLSDWKGLVKELERAPLVRIPESKEDCYAVRKEGLTFLFPASKVEALRFFGKVTTSLLWVLVLVASGVFVGLEVVNHWTFNVQRCKKIIREHFPNLAQHQHLVDFLPYLFAVGGVLFFSPIHRVLPVPQRNRDDEFKDYRDNDRPSDLLKSPKQKRSGNQIPPPSDLGGDWVDRAPPIALKFQSDYMKGKEKDFLPAYDVHNRVANRPKYIGEPAPSSATDVPHEKTVYEDFSNYVKKDDLVPDPELTGPFVASAPEVPDDMFNDKLDTSPESRAEILTDLKRLPGGLINDRKAIIEKLSNSKYRVIASSTPDQIQAALDGNDAERWIPVYNVQHDLVAIVYRPNFHSEEHMDMWYKQLNNAGRAAAKQRLDALEKSQRKKDNRDAGTGFSATKPKKGGSGHRGRDTHRVPTFYESFDTVPESSRNLDVFPSRVQEFLRGKIQLKDLKTDISKMNVLSRLNLLSHLEDFLTVVPVGGVLLKKLGEYKEVLRPLEIKKEGDLQTAVPDSIRKGVGKVVDENGKIVCHFTRIEETAYTVAHIFQQPCDYFLVELDLPSGVRPKNHMKIDRERVILLEDFDCAVYKPGKSSFPPGVKKLKVAPSDHRANRVIYADPGLGRNLASSLGYDGTNTIRHTSPTKLGAGSCGVPLVDPDNNHLVIGIHKQVYNDNSGTGVYNGAVPIFSKVFKDTLEKAVASHPLN